jgi:hypothetical protein
MTDDTYSQRLSSGAGRFGVNADQLKGRVVDGFLNLIDRVEPHIGKAPADMQPAARKAVEVARARPLLTMAGLAVGALVLARGARRR